MGEGELVLVGEDAGAVAQAHTDGQVVALWLHGRGPHTRRAYEADAARFLAFVKKGLREVTLSDLQAYEDALAGQAPNTRRRRLAVVKSLITAAQKFGYVRFNVGAAIQAPKVKDTLAERVLAEDDLQRIFAAEEDARNRTLLRLLYASGARVSELCGLRWCDVQERSQGRAQVTLFGKGGKTRAVLLPPVIARELLALRGQAGQDAPVFLSRKGGALHPSQVLRIVRAAAVRAGIEGKKVSPHWLRHAHATHSLERGAPIHLVQATLGHASVATTGRYLHARPADSSAMRLPL